MIERHDVELLSDIACKIDELKNLFTEPEHRRLLTRAVGDIHRVAVEADAANGYGLYQGEKA